MQDANARILIFAKAPVAGQVKTRLVPELGKHGALQVYYQLLERAVTTVVSANLCPVQLWCAPDTSHAFFQQLETDFLVTLHQQSEGDLGQRMYMASQAALKTADRCILIGTDCPLMDKNYLQQMLNSVSVATPLVMGPAEDGGYVALALSKIHQSLFTGINWGSDEVARVTEERVRALGWNYQKLVTLPDLDTFSDLQALQLTHPGLLSY